MERALRLATWVSAAVLAAGLVMWLGSATYAAPVLHAGIWLLISTPIVRVMMALGDYALARDWTFVGLTLIVLGCLVFPVAMYFLSPPR